MKKRYLVGLISVVLLLLAYYFFQDSIPISLLYTTAWIIVVLALLIAGNSLLARQFDKWLPWLKFGKKRLFSHLFLGIIYSLIIINVAYLSFKLLLTAEPPIMEQIAVTNAYGLVIFIPIYCVYFSLHFLNHWQRSEVETEKFKKETLKSQLDNLKNHLDPHFLFNNLNILSSLIDKDKEESKAFLDKFAEVYRALLKTKDEDLISLQEELEFIDAYIYLIKVRFESNIAFNINVDKSANYKMVPPLTVQLLIENAIKHNIVSEKRPLKIDITTKGDKLTVTNTLYLRPNDSSEMGTGLSNIRRRYAYFSEESIEVSQTEEYFKVEIPLLEVETI